VDIALTATDRSAWLIALQRSEDVDEDKISASFKNGVLTVTLPKAPQAQSKVKRIAVSGK
jgi:HSP20 family molecular chaperone IbpA